MGYLVSILFWDVMCACEYVNKCENIGYNRNGYTFVNGVCFHSFVHVEFAQVLGSNLGVCYQALELVFCFSTWAHLVSASHVDSIESGRLSTYLDEAFTLVINSASMGFIVRHWSLVIFHRLFCIHHQ